MPEPNCPSKPFAVDAVFEAQKTTETIAGMKAVKLLTFRLSCQNLTQGQKKLSKCNRVKKYICYFL